jgi:hypothetical protein
MKGVVMFKHSVVLLTIALVACGSKSGGSKTEDGPQVPDSKDAPGGTPIDPEKKAKDTPTSFALTSATLPTCDATRENQLVWVIDEKVFKYCAATVWTKAEVQAGLVLGKRFRYHTDTYIGQDNLQEGGGVCANIGTIQLVTFTDNSLFVTVSGYVNDSAGGNDFSHTFVAPSSATEQIYIAKVNSYLGSRMRYKTSIVDGVPKMLITCDSDNNLDNNSDWAIPLTEVK